MAIAWMATKYAIPSKAVKMYMPKGYVFTKHLGWGASHVMRHVRSNRKVKASTYRTLKVSS